MPIGKKFGTTIQKYKNIPNLVFIININIMFLSYEKIPLRLKFYHKTLKMYSYQT